MNRSKNYYIYPGVFHFWTDGDGLNQCSISFPDFPGLIAGPSPGATFEEAMDAAREGLALHLEGIIEDGDEIPEPTPIHKLEYDKNPEEGGTVAVALVDVVLSIYRNHMNEYVRVNITLPRWLKEVAEVKQVNFSKVLREGLIDVLDLQKVQK